MTNQVAITMLKNLEQSLDDYCELNDEGKEAFHMAITALELFGNSEQLPSTHSKLEKNSQKLDNKNGELISRQKAKDAIDMALDHIDHVPPWVYDKLLNALNEVPSVKPIHQTPSNTFGTLDCVEKKNGKVFPVEPISYLDCSNAMLKMWMDNVVTDGEYNRIMDKLNAKHGEDVRGNSDD